jgi:hypothetical protein
MSHTFDPIDGKRIDEPDLYSTWQDRAPAAAEAAADQAARAAAEQRAAAEAAERQAAEFRASRAHNEILRAACDRYGIPTRGKVELTLSHRLVLLVEHLEALNG